MLYHLRNNNTNNFIRFMYEIEHHHFTNFIFIKSVVEPDVICHYSDMKMEDPHH